MKFEGGTLVKGAYVVIDGVEHEVHMPEYSGKTPLSAEIFNKMQEDIFPIGSTYITQTNTNPNTILGFGTWERLKGKVVVGLDEDDTDFNEIGKEGGEKTHTLTVDEMPVHEHTGAYKYNNTSNISNLPVASGSDAQALIAVAETGGTLKSPVAGGGQPFNMFQPYKVVGYMWIRTA